MRRKADKPEQKAPEAQEAAAEAAPLVVPRGQTPILKVKPLGSRAGGDGTGAAVRRGTLFQNDAEGQDETAAGLAEEADKRALLKTKADVEREVMSKVPHLLETGRFIPSIDHAVPPCPQENFEHFIELVRGL